MPDSAFLVGQTISHYQILKKLGAGGMGEVYLAHDSALDRTVALKFLLPETQADKTARKRLLAEARSAAALDHPFICKVYEASDADDQPFIAMEYVEGASLTDKLLQGLLPLKEALRIAAEIAEALECAHSRGIVHRDLKPPNILLTRDGHVKVMDFGLAKHVTTGSIGTEETVTTVLTQPGTASGTLAFMAPEQLKGEPADVRSDIFAFGLILYEMIAGAHPFLRNSPLKTACAILDDPLPPITSHGKEVPELLRHTLKRMLAKDREQRCQSVHEVRLNLQELLLERQPPKPAFTAALRILRPVWLGALLLAVAFGVAGASYWIFEHYFRSPKAALAFEKRDWIVIADFENLTRDPVFDRSLQTALLVGIQQSQYVNVLPTARVQEALRRMRKESGAKLDEAVASELAVREGAKAVLACSIAEVGGAYSLSARLVQPHSRAIVLTETTTAQGKGQVLPALDSLAKSVRQKLGESLDGVKEQGLPLPEATTSSLEALTTFAEGLKLAATNRQAGADLVEQAVSIDPDFAMAHAFLGAYYYTTPNSTVRGEEHFVTAMKLLDRLTLREQLWIRAQAEDYRGHREQAVQYYEAYLSQYPDDYLARFRLGWVYMATLHQCDKAIAAFERVLKSNPSDDSSYINLATCYHSMGQTQKALEYYQKAFQIRPAAITEFFVNQEYGALLMETGDTAKAAETFQKMISDQSDLKKAHGYRYIAMLDMYQGKLSDSIANLKQAILLHRTTHNLESEYRDHVLLSSAYRLKGLDRDSLSELETARTILANGHFGPMWIERVAKPYARLGRTAVATKLLHDMISQAQDPTALSAINRNSASDQAVISIVKGELALAAGKSSEAIEAFQLADKLSPHDSASAAESLAFAYRSLGKLQDEARVYEDALGQRKFGLQIEGLEYWLLSHYELAKIYQELGDTAKAKEYYEQFFNTWKDADPDIPVLTAAKAEYARLR
jgi:tetratricopeptide (TPR) repeat protein/predicted Ser/Thr protein kinase